MINLLVTAPIDYVIGALPDDPTEAEQAVYAAIASIDGQWVKAGDDGTDNLFAVITRATEVQPIQDMIDATGVPLTIIHAQDAHETLSEDDEGIITSSTAVYVQASDLLPYMADVVAEDGTTSPATEVSLPIYGGHAEWVI